MIKHFDNYKQRTTYIEFLENKYQLLCEKGIFLLYNAQGFLTSKSCRFPFHGIQRKSFIVDNVRREDKFFLKVQTAGIFAIGELETGIIHDYLVSTEGDANLFNIGLFIFICRALSYHGYGPNGKIHMQVDQKELKLNIDRGYLILKVENNSVIYCKGHESHYALHVRSILADLYVKQYLALVKGE